MRHIRARRADDRKRLVDALRIVHDGDAYPSRWPDDPGAWLYRERVLGAWVAEHAGDLTGHVVLRAAGRQKPVGFWTAASGQDPGRCAVVGRLFVMPPARGTGLGADLLATACAEAGRRGLHPILDVSDLNRQAVRLYRRLGWVPLGSYLETFGGHGPPELMHCFAAPDPAMRAR